VSVPLLSVALLFSGPARAEEEAVRVQYAAEGSCPDEASFVARVRGRTEHGRFAAPGELARTFAVRLAQTNGGFSGEIAFTDVDGQNAERTVAGATCDEVASSLALIMALSIDDRVAQTQAVAPSASTPAPSNAAESAPPKKEVVAAGGAPNSAAASPRVPERSAPGPRLRLELGLNAGAESWVMPQVALVLGAFAELGRGTRGFRLRLSAFDTRQTVDRDFGQARFANEFLRAEACPFAVALSRSLAVSPCAGIDAGALRASASGARLARVDSGHTHGWLSALGLVRLEWELGSRFVLGADGELGVPLVRDKFQFLSTLGAADSVFVVPALGAGAKVQIGVRP